MTMITGPREAQLFDAVNLLLDARRTAQPIPELPAAVVPTNMEEVVFIQDELLKVYGAVGGWKVGAPTLEATPLATPMPQAWMQMVASPPQRLRGIEAEVAFLLGEDLPPRARPYTHEEVYAAVASCHPAIEVIDSGIGDPTRADVRMSQLADLQMHGGFVFGPACEDWRSIDWHQEHVQLAIDGSIRFEATGSNTSGDLMRLLPWLANEGARRTGGLHAGQWITTGSWTGVLFGLSGSAVDVQFDHLGRVGLHFA